MQDACRLVPELTRLLASRGLGLEKFMSNNAQVLASIPEGARAECMAKYKLGDNLPQKRVLGMTLDLASNVFCYDVKPLHKPMTRRGMLSEPSSVF